MDFGPLNDPDPEVRAKARAEVSRRITADVVEVMRQYIAADLPNPFAMAAEVLDIQNHAHSYSCLRNGQCRHGYPQPALSWADFIDIKVTVPESVEEVLEAMGVAQRDGSTGELELCPELQGGKNLPARSPASTSMSTSQPSLFVETEWSHHNVQHNDATQFENSYIVNYSAREDERSLVRFTPKDKDKARLEFVDRNIRERLAKEANKGKDEYHKTRESLPEPELVSLLHQRPSTYCAEVVDREHGVLRPIEFQHFSTALPSEPYVVAKKKQPDQAEEGETGPLFGGPTSADSLVQHVETLAAERQASVGQLRTYIRWLYSDKCPDNVGKSNLGPPSLCAKVLPFWVFMECAVRTGMQLTKSKGNRHPLEDAGVPRGLTTEKPGFLGLRGEQWKLRPAFFTHPDYAGYAEKVCSHFLSVYFFSIDPQHFVDGSTSSPGYSVIGENPGLFKFWSISRSFQIIISIPEFKSTLAIFQLTPSHLFVHPENTMNFTLFGSSKAADDGLSTLFNYSPSHLFQKHQASNSPLQTRFPSRQLEAIEGKIFDTRQRIFVPEVYRRLQDYSEFYLDVEGTDIQSAFVGSNSTEILDRGRVSSVAHNNYNELEKLLFKHKRFYLKPYELDYSQAEAKESPPTATPWAKQLRTVLDKAKEENKDLKGWFVIPAWDAQVVAATFRMLGSTSALFPLLPYISSVICMHGAQLRDAYKVKRDGKDSYEFRTSGHQTMPYVALLLNTSSFDGCRYEDINFKFEPFRFAAKHAHPTVRDLRLHKTLRFEVSIEFLDHIEPSPPEERDKTKPRQRKIGDARAFMKLMNEMFVPALANVSVNTKNAYYPFGHIVPSESPHWAYYRFDWELPSRFADELMFKVRECAQFLTGELLAMDMHALPTTEVYRAVIARDRKERNKDLQAPEMLTMMIANLPGGRGASPPLGAMFRSKDSLVVAIDTTHAPCDVTKTGVQTLAIRFFHSCGIVLFHGIDGQLVRFSSRSDGNARSAPSGAPERAHATPAPPSYDSSKAPKTAVLLVAPRSAHALDLRVQAGFLGPYVSFEPTRPPYEHQQAYLVVYEKGESALLAHDFKYGDAAFAPLHRNLIALEKILPAQDPDVAEHEQPIVQRLQAGAALGSTAFVSQLVTALRERPATGLTERISEWNAAPEDADAATPTPGPSRTEEMSETSVPLLAPLGGEATTLLPPDHGAPTPASDIQIDPRLPAGFYYVRDVFSESQEETVKKILHDNTWEKYHGRSVQHFGHAYLGPSKVTATSPIPEEFSSILQTYNAALERLGLSHPPPNQITGTMYLPGEGIGYHGDDPLLGDPVSIFGSQSDTTMFFKNPSNGDSFRIRLFARSLLVLTGAARHEWHHGIPRRREDEVFGLTVPRTVPRLALILRHIPQAS